MRQLLSLMFVFLFGQAVQAQSFVFAELQGQPLMNTTNWTTIGAAGIGDTNGDVDTFSNELILTQPVNSSSGGIFYDFPLDLTRCMRWTATFDFRIFDGTSADGLAFCFLDVPPTGFVTGGGMGIPAAANGLKVVFDTYDNGCGANPEIQIFSGVGYNECIVGIQKVNNTGGNLNFMRSSAYNQVEIQYDSGFIDVVVNGTLWLSQVFAPVSFSGYLGFTSGTGAQNDRHSIRNVSVFTDGSALGGFLSLDTASRWPVIEVPCYAQGFSLKTIGNFLCSSVDTNGSDFRLYAPNGILNPVMQVRYDCQSGRADSLFFELGLPLNRAGDHYLVLRNGIDGNAILGDCGAELHPFDTIIVRVVDCYSYDLPVHMRQVTVLPGDDSLLLRWSFPQGLDSAFFDGYRLQMNEALDGTDWQPLGLVSDWQDTLLRIAPFNPRLEARDFRVVLQVRENPDAPPGDSIGNILLQNPDGQLTDSNALVAALQWSAYDKAAPDPIYQLWLLSAAGDSLLLQSGAGRELLYTKPLQQGQYRLVVTAQAPTDPHGSRSNELAFEIPLKEVQVYNVITPNGDGFNDFLTIRNILYHPEAELWVFNRWGQEVFAAVGYQNDWSPTTLEAGNYVYRLRIPEQPELSGMLRIVK